ncbi:MAG: molybdate ABC transporter substrate-binding protein [Rhodanobacteraceae bacterium]
MPVAARARDLLVFAAASMKPSLDAILALPESKAIGNIKASYAASSQLARQIEAGAPASLYISADEDWMDYLADRGLVAPDTREDLLVNGLVLVAPKDSTVKLVIEPGFDLIGALGTDGKLALAEPDSVPAGKYAKTALIHLGVWARVMTHVVAAQNVRAALNFVARGEAPLGIVYRSDAVSEPRVRVVATFPDSSHAPIVYPVAIVAANDSPAARRFLAMLHAPEQQTTFRRYGFGLPSK